MPIAYPKERTMTATTAPESKIPHMVLVAKGRDDAYRAHRTTCKRVPAGAIEMTSFAAVNADHATPAGCCKPTLPEPGTADGFDEWVADQGQPATVQIGGDEVVIVHDEKAPAAATDRMERLALAKAEHKTLREWIRNGEKPPRPATPNLDALNDEHAANQAGGGRKKAKAKGAGAVAQGVTVRFHHDGKAMPNSQNKLSSVAYYFTKGIDGDSPRVTTDALRAILAKAGITDPSNTEWTHTLANGVVLSTTRL